MIPLHLLLWDSIKKTVPEDKKQGVAMKINAKIIIAIQYKHNSLSAIHRKH